MIYFQVRSHSELLGFRTSTYLFETHNLTHNSGYIACPLSKSGIPILTLNIVLLLQGQKLLWESLIPEISIWRAVHDSLSWYKCLSQDVLFFLSSAAIVDVLPDSAC